MLTCFWKDGRRTIRPIRLIKSRKCWIQDQCLPENTKCKIGKSLKHWNQEAKSPPPPTHFLQHTYYFDKFTTSMAHKLREELNVAWREDFCLNLWRVLCRDSTAFSITRYTRTPDLGGFGGREFELKFKFNCWSFPGFLWQLYGKIGFKALGKYSGPFWFNKSSIWLSKNIQTSTFIISNLLGLAGPLIYGLASAKILLKI